MKGIKKVYILFALMLCAMMAFSQDRLYLTNGQVLDVRIDQIMQDTIIYFNEIDSLEIRHKILTNEVIRIFRADGSTETFSKGYLDPAFYTHQSKRGLKFHLFSPLLGHSGFSYEHNIRPGRALEVEFGMIGLGNNFSLGSYQSEGAFREVSQNQLGGYFGLGYKFYSKPVIRSTGWHYQHLLHGWYLMPKAIFGYYKENELVESFTGGFYIQNLKRHPTSFGGLMLYAGKQLVFSEAFLLEWQIGMGLGFDSDDEKVSDHYVNTIVNKFLMLGGGLRAGFVF